MKHSLMRPPAISEIYSQKKVYDNHLKKLSQIRLDRKIQLQQDQSRNSQLQNIRQTKSKTFANKFNEQSSNITQSNVKLLVKLERVKPYVRHSSHSVTERSFRETSHLNPSRKKRIIETEKENSRIFVKMRSVSSNLGRQRMRNQYAKAQQIKDRITRFSCQDNRVTLKSQKFLGQNKSVSNRSLSASRDSLKKNLVQHYNKEDIMKNKIVNADHRLLKNKRLNRALPSLPSKPIDIEEHSYDYVEDNAPQKPSFFATEPNRKRTNSYTHKLK